MTDTPTKKESREAKFKRLFPWVDPKYASGPWADPEEYDAIALPPELQEIKEKMKEEFITPYNLPWLPGSVLKKLVEASKLDQSQRGPLLEKAWDSVRMSHLADIARGRIKIKDENAPPMPEDVKQKLRELNEQRREEKRAKKAEFARFEEPKKPKVPVFMDREKQIEVKKKYPWVIEGSFKMDPEKQGGTLVNIQCQKCESPRTIHLADAFQVKLCTKCKGSHANNKKLGQQSPGR